MVLTACPVPSGAVLTSCGVPEGAWVTQCGGDTFRIFYDEEGWPMYSTDPGVSEANFYDDGSSVLIVEGGEHLMFSRVTDLGAETREEA